MQNRALQLLAVILLAIRRAMTSLTIKKADPLYGNAPCLAKTCVHLQVARWIANPDGWYMDVRGDLVLDDPVFGRYRLYDPSTDSQLSSGLWFLSCKGDILLKQDMDSGSLNDLRRVVCDRIRAGIDHALDGWLTDSSPWVEDSGWPQTTRHFILRPDAKLLPQDHDRTYYKLFVYPSDNELVLQRDGCTCRHGDKDPRVQQLYDNLCQREPLAVSA